MYDFDLLYRFRNAKDNLSKVYVVEEQNDLRAFIDRDSARHFGFEIIHELTVETVSYAEIYKQLSDLNIIKPVKPSGLLPQGARIFAGELQNYYLIYEMPAKIRTLQIDVREFNMYNRYFDRKEYKIEKAILQIPCPICVFYIKIVNHRPIDMRMACLKEPLNSKKDILYRFPFGNTSYNGRICWGTIFLPKMNEPAETTKIGNLFFDSVFNGHIIDNLTMNEIKIEGETIEDPLSLLMKLHNKKEFPSEVLVKMNETITDWTGEGNGTQG